MFQVTKKYLAFNTPIYSIIQYLFEDKRKIYNWGLDINILKELNKFKLKKRKIKININRIIKKRIIC